MAKIFPIWIVLFVIIFGVACNKEENEIPIQENKLTVDFSFSGDNCDAPCAINFTNLSENASRYLWDFGDNLTSDETNPVHTYQNPGSYTVTLTAYDIDDNEVEVSKTVSIIDGGPVFYTGMDLSYQSHLKDFNVQYYDEDGNAIDNLFQFVKDNGVNLIRIRLFHSPENGSDVVKSSNLSNVLELCQQVKATNNKILLDIHYSDTWADPGHQTVPAAWQGLSFDVLKDSVYQYTKYVLEKLDAQNTLPEMVQIGNETNSGFLWGQGRVWNEFNNNWGNYAELINSANQAIVDIENQTGNSISTIVHVAGVTYKTTFFDKLAEHNAEFDIIGLSHYARHHTQNLQLMQSELNKLSDKYDKPILIAETNYPWTLGWNDWTNNVVGLEEHLISGYPATPEGQKIYYEKMVEILNNVTGGNGLGFVWWAPDLVAFNGPESKDGSAFENVTTFDFDNKALPVFEVFESH